MAFIKTKLSTIRPDDLYDTLRLTYGFNDEEQQKQPGILAKPAEPVSDSDVVAAGFFDYVFTKSRERAAKVRAEAMEQYARDSAEEAAKIRSILGITRSKAPTGQLSDQARDAMFSSSDIRGAELTMKDNAREAQDVAQPMITPVSRGEQPEMADSPAPFDAPSVDTRSNEMLDKAIQDVLETVLDSDVSDSTDSADGGAAPSGGKGIMSREALTDDDMGLPDEPSQVESLKGLYATKGKAYKDSNIKKHSHVKEPIIEGGIRGNSRIGGDASIETQTKVINKIVQMGRNENMSEEDIGFMLAMARVESGFNPDAAAGTTSASGIGQFIDATGKTYGINDTNRWDLESQVDALIGYTKFNKEKVIKDGRDQKDLYKWMYKYHHDGPNSTKPTSTSLGWKVANKKVNPLVNKYTEYVKNLDPLQGPELPERTSLGSIRPSARPETNVQVASN